MTPDEKEFTVTQAGNLCGVGRSTINYWIRTKKVHAKKHGNKYLIPAEELLLLLKSRGKHLPSALKPEHTHEPIFRKKIPCWEYWKDTRHGEGCKGCVVSGNKLETCFNAKESDRLQCETDCNECHYYQKIYLPRIRFVHQFDFPAAITREFYFLCGNYKWAKLCEVPVEELPGMGIENVFHADSLEMMISNIKKERLGERLPVSYNIFLKNRRRGKLRAAISLFPLSEPAGTLIAALSQASPPG
jgi:excisionase family DNA binding protein